MFASPESITLANASLALQAGLAAIAGGDTEFDLAHLQTVDSAAVATVLAWQRAALKSGRSLKLHNLPANLASLMDLYSVADLLPAAAAISPAYGQHSGRH